MSYYTDTQYSGQLPKGAKKDLKIFFFDSVFKNSKKMLDVGCSVGRIMEIAPEKFEGIDIDKKALEIAKKKGLKVKFANITEKLPFGKESFDGVYCSQIIEHLEDPLHLVLEVKRILKKGGKAVFITPDYLISSRAKRNNFWDDYTHKTPFTRQSLKKISCDAGLKRFRSYHFPGRIFRQLIRKGIISKEEWIKIEDSPFVTKSHDIVLEIIKQK